MERGGREELDLSNSERRERSERRQARERGVESDWGELLRRRESGSV